MVKSFFDKIFKKSKNFEKDLKIEKEIKEFKKEKEKKVIKQGECKTCKNKNFCQIKGKFSSDFFCNFNIKIDFDENKESIIIIDDNPGIVSLIKEEIKHCNYNIITFTNEDCGFFARSFFENYKDTLKIKALIVDLYFPSIKVSKTKNLKLNGIDIIFSAKRFLKNKNFTFYIISGISFLDEYKKKFEAIFSDNLENYVYTKNQIRKIIDKINCGEKENDKK